MPNARIPAIRNDRQARALYERARKVSQATGSVGHGYDAKRLYGYMHQGMAVWLYVYYSVTSRDQPRDHPNYLMIDLSDHLKTIARTAKAQQDMTLDLERIITDWVALLTSQRQHVDNQVKRGPK